MDRARVVIPLSATLRHLTNEAARPFLVASIRLDHREHVHVLRGIAVAAAFDRGLTRFFDEFPRPLPVPGAQLDTTEAFEIDADRLPIEVASPCDQLFVQRPRLVRSTRRRELVRQLIPSERIVVHFGSAAAILDRHRSLQDVALRPQSCEERHAPNRRQRAAEHAFVPGLLGQLERSTREVEALARRLDHRAVRGIREDQRRERRVAVCVLQGLVEEHPRLGSIVGRVSREPQQRFGATVPGRRRINGLAQECLTTITIAGCSRELARDEEAPMAERVVRRRRHPYGVRREIGGGRGRPAAGGSVSGVIEQRCSLRVGSLRRSRAMPRAFLRVVDHIGQPRMDPPPFASVHLVEDHGRKQRMIEADPAALDHRNARRDSLVDSAGTGGCLDPVEGGVGEEGGGSQRLSGGAREFCEAS